LHFKSENARRKKLIVKLMRGLNCQLVVVKCRTPQASARLCALNSLVTSDLASSCARIVLELDETVRVKDNAYLKQQSRLAEWDHKQRHEEPLLWVADAVAWCVNRGGEWERMVRPMIVETIEC
jgi:EAL domain-containing protein (putative c-di-GMP-specific phosphodiesterase class I)